MKWETSRRDLLKMSALAAATGPAMWPLTREVRAAQETPRPDPWKGLKMGVASYSLRKLPLEGAIAAIRRVGLNYVSIKDMHLPLRSSSEERRAVVAKFKAAGVTPLSCGVITLTKDEKPSRNAFEYARDCSMPVIVAHVDRDALELTEKLAKEFDLKVAIHNHGPEDKRFPSPYDAMKEIEKLDARVGLCIDVGHTARARVDPAESIRKCAARVYDIHMKDINTTFPTGKSVEIGRGVLDVRGMLQALLDIKFTGHVGIEYEKDADDVMPGLAESVGYLRGVVATLL